MKTGSLQSLQKIQVGDILAAVSERMGADIETPGERFRRTDLGPAWTRSGTQSTCRTTGRDGSRLLIQASETDPEGIQSVLLTPRTKAAAVVASGRAGKFCGQARFPNRRNLQPNRSPAEVSGGENSAEPAILAWKCQPRALTASRSSNPQQPSCRPHRYYRRRCGQIGTKNQNK